MEGSFEFYLIAGGNPLTVTGEVKLRAMQDRSR